jgi:hypothetical protein
LPSGAHAPSRSAIQAPASRSIASSLPSGAIVHSAS